jgi:hypothetical protein
MTIPLTPVQLDILIGASLNGVAPLDAPIRAELAQMRVLGLVRADDDGQHLLTTFGKEQLSRAIHGGDVTSQSHEEASAAPVPPMHD